MRPSLTLAETAHDTSNSNSGQEEAASIDRRGGTNGSACATLGNGGSAHSGHPEYSGPRGPSQVGAFILDLPDVGTYRMIVSTVWRTDKDETRLLS